MEDEHANHNHGSDWTSCTLCRTRRQSELLLAKAKQRHIDWSEPKRPKTRPNIPDPTVYTSIDDAFSSIMQYMSTTSRQCKRFHSSSPETSQDKKDHVHHNRFHDENYVSAHRKNPLQSAEDVHLIVQPGTYSITTGEWGEPNHQQTHVVHVDPGQTVDVDFVM